MLKTVHEHGAITDASLSVLSDQLVQKASMDRVVTMNRCAQESRGGLNVKHHPLLRGRAGMAHGRHHRPAKQSSQLPSHMPSSYTGEENKFLQRDGAQQAKRLGNARQDEGYAAEL